MSRRRRLHYSASLAVIVAALATLYEGRGGGLILVPGFAARLFLEFPLSLLLTDSDHYALPSYVEAVFTAGHYFLIIYFVLLVRTRLWEEGGRR
jgi:hypothetical protein